MRGKKSASTKVKMLQPGSIEDGEHTAFWDDGSIFDILIPLVRGGAMKNNAQASQKQKKRFPLGWSFGSKKPTMGTP